MRFFILTIITVLSSALSFSQARYQKDFLYYWQTINDNFAYFHRQHCNWDSVKQIYQPYVDRIRDKSEFITLLENVNNELYNGHVFLNTNMPSSNRTIPSGSDLKISVVGNDFIINEIREGFSADSSGLKIGMKILAYNDVAIEQAILQFLPRSVARHDKEMKEYAANMVLAGRHNTKRKITASLNGKTVDYFPDANMNRTERDHDAVLESRILAGNTGYIRINNSLGNSDLIKAFDDALDKLLGTKAMILDLRETPSGGNTTIARAIMGRFINRELPYQKHIYTAETKETGIARSTLELVSPRAKIYSKPLVVLVGYWTGSMGEGMAIGFDGMKRALVAGTQMAGLLGEIFTFEMPDSKIPFSFPAVRLQHINGKPREDFIPPAIIKDQRNAVETARVLALKLVAKK